MLALIAVGHGLLVIAFTIRILLRDDLSPPARLAWFIVINLIPYFGSASYFLFGEIDIGHKTRQKHEAISKNLRKFARTLEIDGVDGAHLIDPLYRPAFEYASSINGFAIASGNSAELMSSPEETVKRMIGDIDNAKDHVHVLYYIWLDDHTGRCLAEALMRASARGVTCRAMADGLGSRALIGSRLWQDMEVAGVQLAIAFPLNNPVRTILTSRLDLRNHRKITVIDGAITYCGSRNSADPEFRIKPKFAPWVDIMLRFQGPVATQNQLLFFSDWIAATNETPANMPSLFQETEGGFPAVNVGDGPTVRRGATPQLFSSLIATARHSITISTPYFVPDATLVEALSAAAHRGVSVTLIFPEKNDSWIVAAASRSYYRKLLEAGCLIYEYRGGLLHAKTFTMDKKISVIGSSNLDLRSFELNYENNVALQDEDTTRAIQDRQQEYIDASQSIQIADVLSWSPQRRIWHNIVATVGPIL